MALHWDWNEKCGEAIIRQTFVKDDVEVTEDVTLHLYTGNAYLIFVYKFENTDIVKYNVQSFWVDKTHMKRCLGLDKSGDFTVNYYDRPYFKLTKIRLEKKKCRYIKDIVAHLVKAFDDLTIEIYTEEDKE